MAATSWASLVTLLTLSISFSSSSIVPVVTWWSDKSIQAPSVYAGHSINKKEFQSLIQPVLSKTDVLLLFLQDELSIDDFTRHSRSFTFVKKSLASSNHVVFPSVNLKDETVLDYIKELKEVNIVNVALGEDDVESVKNQLKNDILNVVVVKLEPLRDGNMESKEIILKRNNEIINSITQKFSKLSKQITSLYTSEDLSIDIQNILVNEELENSHNIKSRHILEDNKGIQQSNGKFLRSKCVMMYLTGLKVGKDKSNSTNVIAVIDNTTTAAGSCHEGISYEIVIKLSGGKGAIGSDFTLTMKLINNNATAEWMCDSIEAKGDVGGEQMDSTFACGNFEVPWTATAENTIMAPNQFSFACNVMSFNDGNYTVQLDGLQLQPTSKNVTSNEFLDAYQCEGFFTLPILTGLLVGALLIASLYMGAMMMMNIQTQDRFDDPKGKTIQVAAQE